MARTRPRALVIGSEAVPFAKTGGLADVLGALPAAIADSGWDVTLVLPRYRGVEDGRLVETRMLTVGAFTREAAYYEAPLGAARAVLVACPDLFAREFLYGQGNEDYPDNPRRFAFLVRAALEYASAPERRPDVVHAHDWQAGLAPVYLRSLYAAHPVLGGTPSVFTIHNLAYQGLAEPDWLPRLDLPWDLLGIDRMEFWGRISLLKGGITDASHVTTVSPRYAREIQTPALGSGFDGILRARAGVLTGILNGIDTAVWDPARDPFLPAPFDATDLSGKRAAKRALLERFGLPADEAALARPLAGMVSRLIDQKGLDLIAAAADRLIARDLAFTIVGTGEPRYQDLWRALAARHPARVGVFIGFDEAHAHLVEGGADMFLMPSRFEPCGLNQMYSLRYGTVPVVRAVGGLADTVFDAGPASGPVRGNGFVFDDDSAEALLAALGRALEAFARPDRWRAIQAAGMAADHSWHRSAREYVKIYDRVRRNRPGGAGSPRRPRRGQ
jgi:starch synthase